MLVKNFDINFIDVRLVRLYETITRGLKIGKTAFASERPIIGDEIEIINAIHRKRFNSRNAYVTSGGHFSQLYVRNLGIFYNALLDSRIPTTHADWLLREQIALRTVAIDLEVFRRARKAFTTIAPMHEHFYTAANIYTQPSDSLFAILYALCALTDNEYIDELFPSHDKSIQKFALHTKAAGRSLLKAYKPLLRRLLKSYLESVLDKKTQLVKTSIFLSSARDGVRRSSSFYDNVICWATMRLAHSLGLVKNNKKFFDDWKARIIISFWNEEEGLFKDDLSEKTHNETLFSADSFIVTSTAFLNIENSNDRDKLLRMVQYVKNHQLDQPFPLRYSLKNNPKQQYKRVRYFAPSYMGDSIWSHWGMEYIKALILLSPSDPSLLVDAERHLAAYKQNIERYGGYPELYNKKGDMLKSRIYKSILHTGWVINYEQAKMLYEGARSKVV